MKKVEILSLKENEEIGEKLFVPTTSLKEEKVGAALPAYKPSLEFLLTFKENRSYELHLGKTIIMFQGRETKKISKSLFDHKDFTSVIRNKFVIREVKNG